MTVVVGTGVGTGAEQNCGRGISGDGISVGIVDGILVVKLGMNVGV